MLFETDTKIVLKLLGVRGSRPTHKPGMLGYGGNSTSFQIEVEGKDFDIFIDGGSGLAHAGMRMGRRTRKRQFHMLVTHTHWDHIMGYPFFAPLYNPHNRFTFYSSRTSRSEFETLFFGIHREDNIPIPPSKMVAPLKFQTIKTGDVFFIENQVQVSTYQLNHKCITLGYRLDTKNDSVAIITDNAPIEDGNYMGENMKELAAADPAAFEKRFNKGLEDFLKGCHTVVFDTHFTEANLKPDWGHSTPQRALKFCENATGVSRLILFHHAPEDSDKDVKNKVDSVKEIGEKIGIEVVAAKEGAKWDLR